MNKLLVLLLILPMFGFTKDAWDRIEERINSFYKKEKIKMFSLLNEDGFKDCKGFFNFKKDKITLNKESSKEVNVKIILNSIYNLDYMAEKDQYNEISSNCSTLIREVDADMSSFGSKGRHGTEGNNNNTKQPAS